VPKSSVTQASRNLDGGEHGFWTSSSRGSNAQRLTDIGIAAMAARLYWAVDEASLAAVDKDGSGAGTIGSAGGIVSVGGVVVPSAGAGEVAACWFSVGGIRDTDVRISVRRWGLACRRCTCGRGAGGFSSQQRFQLSAGYADRYAGVVSCAEL
jgi:hypothetical protein